jgi:4-hydroxythreonine-4-phosphate dehydrogenase
MRESSVNAEGSGTRRRLVIVADDLTGAADAAAAFAPSATTSVVLRQTDRSPVREVLSVDTNSRYLTAPESTAAVESAVAQAVRLEADLYKKIDSTLRGNVVAEVAATLRTAGAELALIAPAFPSTGRTVVDGIVHVDGRPLPGGNLQHLFSEGELKTAVVGLGTVRAGARALQGAIERHQRDGALAICIDAETDDDLRVVRDVTVASSVTVVPVGSAGLARVMSAAWATPSHGSLPLPASRQGAVLMVLGSYSSVARAQVRALTSKATTVTIAEPFGSAEILRAGAKLRQALSGGDAVLVPDPASPVRRDRAARIADALATVGGGALSEQHDQLAGCLLSGGETARAVLLAAGVATVDISGELEPGIVLASAPDLDGLPLVTKAGAFGDPGALERARVALHRGAGLSAHPINPATTQNHHGVPPLANHTSNGHHHAA